MDSQKTAVSSLLDEVKAIVEKSLVQRGFHNPCSVEKKSPYILVQCMPNSGIVCHYSLDFRERISSHGDIELPERMKKKGYARKLVEAREEVCRKLSIDFIVINYCTNASFWEHMGYASMTESDFEVKQRCGNIHPKFLRDPRFKDLRVSY
jgi:GNAT superfamily N-acetyltransferase